jgi:hypothetical protein
VGCYSKDVVPVPVTGDAPASHETTTTWNGMLVENLSQKRNWISVQTFSLKVLFNGCKIGTRRARLEKHPKKASYKEPDTGSI